MRPRPKIGASCRAARGWRPRRPTASSAPAPCRRSGKCRALGARSAGASGRSTAPRPPWARQHWGCGRLGRRGSAPVPQRTFRGNGRCRRNSRCRRARRDVRSRGRRPSRTRGHAREPAAARENFLGVTARPQSSRAFFRRWVHAGYMARALLGHRGCSSGCVIRPCSDSRPWIARSSVTPFLPAVWPRSSS